MPRQVFRFDPPERFVTGTVGEPGERTFFLQARGGGRVVSVALEKEQVAVLAERMGALLDEVVRRSGGEASVPALPPPNQEDLEPLDQPIEEEFRVGTLTLAWEAADELVVVEAFEVVDEELPDDLPAADDPRDVLIVRLPGPMARGFVKRATAVVSAGRPPCPLCGQPLDPAGHVCPRQNGYRRRG